MLTTLLTRLSGPPLSSSKAAVQRGAYHDVFIQHTRYPASACDGMRVLVERSWPRGMPREGLVIDLWLKEIAPTRGLSHWHLQAFDKQEEFSRRYRAELLGSQDLLHVLHDLRMRGPLTLLCDAQDPNLSHAAVLRELLIKNELPAPTFKGERP